MGKALFITGTGTDIGKTYVTALIVKKLREAGLDGGYYKAALSGAIPDSAGKLLPGDALCVNRVAGLGEQTEHLVTYVYRDAVSPHLAALREGNPVEMEKIEADYQASLAKYDYVTMEGSGGIICPLRWDEQHVILDDLVKDLGLGVLIIADAGLGTINSAVLTIEHLRARDIPIRGLIFNKYVPGNLMQDDNADMIEAMTGVKVVAYVKEGDTDLDIDVDFLKNLYA